MKRASIVAILLWLSAPAKAEDLTQKWTNLDLKSIISGKSDMFTLYAGKQAVLIQYVIAMRVYGAAVGRNDVRGITTAFRQAHSSPAGGLWTWIGANGDSVQRVRKDVFRISVGNYTGNWFTELDCIALEWPMFLCSDGKERKMSAPASDRMVFDGIEYRRFQPGK